MSEPLHPTVAAVARLVDEEALLREAHKKTVAENQRLRAKLEARSEKEEEDHETRPG